MSEPDPRYRLGLVMRPDPPQPRVKRPATVVQQQAPVLEPSAAEADPAELQVEVDGAVYALAPSDVAKLTGAFLLALNGQETAIALASGETLTVTPANALSIATQLAGAST